MEYGKRLAGAIERYGNLCVGIDPHRSQLEAWGLDDDLAGLEKFSLTLVEAMSGTVGVVKPQSAFFERFGSRGIAVLERVLSQAKAAGLLTILDVKRGDIGSTMAGYAQAYLDPSSPLSADAITLSPFLGFGSLTPAIEAARRYQKGLYILALTSNPEGPQVQHARGQEGKTVAENIINSANSLNLQASGKDHIGDLGLVVGATIGESLKRLNINLSVFSGSFLAPGIGAQGASPADIQQIFGKAIPRVLASSSRAISSKGPKVAQLRDGALQALAEISDIFPASNGN